MLLYLPPTISYVPTSEGYRREIIPSTRIGLALEPPEDKETNHGAGAG